jgi:uncharacterized Zn finger protein
MIPAIPSQRREFEGTRMSKSFTITQAAIRDLAEPVVFARGQAYWQQGAVTNLIRSDDQITALVQGSDIEAYRVRITVARLNVLERQGRFQEYLYLAEAEGQTERFLTMLVRVGRVTEAVEKGREWLTQPQEILVLANALHEHGAHEEALQLAERGVALKPPGGAPGGWVADEDEAVGIVYRHDSAGWSYYRAQLARWLRETAASLGQTLRALPAARVVMEEAPSLEDYQALETVAGEEWPQLQAEVLDRLRAPIPAIQDDAVEIFLHERLWDDAIAAVDRGYHGHVIVRRVVEAVLRERPEWAMNACFHQAAQIIEPGSAQYYAAAAEWLAKARAAAAAGGLLSQWEQRMDEIMSRHQRKYKLMPMLKALR